MLRIQWACSSGTAAQQGGCQRIKRAIISRNGKRQLRVVGQMLQPFRIRARGMEAGLSAAPAILPVSMHTLVRIAVFKVGLACFLWGGQPPSQMLCADGAQGGDPVRVDAARRGDAGLLVTFRLAAGAKPHAVHGGHVQLPQGNCPLELGRAGSVPGTDEGTGTGTMPSACEPLRLEPHAKLLADSGLSTVKSTPPSTDGFGCSRGR